MTDLSKIMRESAKACYEQYANIQMELDQGPVKASRWKNLWFLKNGRSGLGDLVHPTELAAKQISDASDVECAACAAANPTGDCMIWSPHGAFSFKWSEYSHTVQIPWLK